MTVIGSAGKVSSNRRFSLAFAITGEVVPGFRFKLILGLDADEAEAAEAIAAYLDTVRAICEDRLSEADWKALLTHSPVGGTALVTFDPATRQIIPVNGLAREPDSTS